MLQKVSGKSSLLLIGTIIVIGTTSVVLFTKYTDRISQTANNDTQSETSKNELMPLEPTDKQEIAQEALVEPPKVSKEVKAAEQQLPAVNAPAYRPACKELKGMYQTEHQRNVQAEEKKHKSIQQDILESFSKKGMSFSKSQKSAQSSEQKRHEKALEQIDGLLKKQLTSVSC